MGDLENDNTLSYDDILKSLDNFQDDMESEFGFSFDDANNDTNPQSTQHQLNNIDNLLNNLNAKQKEWSSMDSLAFDETHFFKNFQSSGPSQHSQDDEKTTFHHIGSGPIDIQNLGDNKNLSTEEKARRLLSDLSSSFILEIDEVHLFNKLSTSGHFADNEDLSKAIQLIKKDCRESPVKEINSKSLEEERVSIESEQKMQTEYETQQVRLFEQRSIQLEEQKKMLEEQRVLLQNLKENTSEEERLQIEEREKKINDQIQIQEEHIQDHNMKEKQLESMREKLKKDQDERQKNFEERQKLWQKSVQERTRHNPDSPSSSFGSPSDSLIQRADSLKRMYRRSLASIKNIRTESSSKNFKVSEKELIKPSKQFIENIIQKIIPNPNINKNSRNVNPNDVINYTIIRKEPHVNERSFSITQDESSHKDEEPSSNIDEIPPPPCPDDEPSSNTDETSSPPCPDDEPSSNIDEAPLPCPDDEPSSNTDETSPPPCPNDEPSSNIDEIPPPPCPDDEVFSNTDETPAPPCPDETLPISDLPTDHISLDHLLDDKLLDNNCYFKDSNESRDFLNDILNSDLNFDEIGSTPTNRETVNLVEDMDAVLDSFLKNSE